MTRSLALTLAAATLVGCSSTPEQPLLQQFFTASRLRDNTTLAGFAATAFEPGTDGVVTTFTITNVTPEQRKPLTLRTIAMAQEEAKAEDAAFAKRKDEYLNENAEVLQRVVKAGRDARLKGKDAEVQTSWFKLMDDGVAISRKVSDARRSLAAQSGVVDLSVNGDPRNRIDVTKRDGDLVSKDVTIDAPVKLPNGQTTQKTLIVTLQRAELSGEKPITGRWIVTGIRDGSGPPATPRS